jgi:hypothetical protein
MSPRSSGQKRRGRPKKVDLLSPVSTRVPTSTHDKLIEKARQADKPVSEFLRDFLLKHFPY